jgi:3-oxoacyl-[acyl-carrier-protein] synthase II
MAGPVPRDEAIAITGMAWDTALGSGIEEVWHLVLAGADGFREFPSVVPVRSERAARLAAGPPAGSFHEQYVEVTAGTARRALADAGLADGTGCLLVLGTSLGPHADPPAAGSLYTWAEETGRRLGVATAPVAVSTACSAGSDALTVAATLIRAGRADRCLAGGVDLLSPAKLLGHSAMGVMSPTVLRPFDTGRDGTLPGEGAAVLVVERLSAARERGASVRGFLRGWGAATAGESLNEPDASGVTGAQAVLRSLGMGGRDPAEIAVISLHGTGTAANDDAEAEIVRRVFGAHAPGPVVLASKGAFGHTLGASGAIDTVLALLALRDRTAPPIAHLRTAPPDFPLPLPIGSPMAVPGEFALNLTLGIGGFTTCLLLQRGDGAWPRDP